MVLRWTLFLVLLPLYVPAQTTYLLQTLAGSDEVGDGGAATSALIAQVQGIAVDNQGVLYLADADGHRIRRVLPSGMISTVAGTGHPAFSGDGGPAASAAINTPYGLALDRTGNLYIADLGNARIRRVSRDGSISTIAGGGTTPPAQADGHPATEVALKSPRNVAVDSYGNVYFSDFGGHRVYQITPAGMLLRVAGTGTAGLFGDGGFALSAQLSSPAGLAVDASGTLYIADSSNARIRKVWRGVITTAGDTGKPGAPPVIPLGIPTGIALDADGSMFIADAGHSTLFRVTPLMQVSAIPQPARDVAIDAAGSIYSCSASYVYRRNRAGILSVAAGSGIHSFAGDGGPAHKARFASPSAVARDAAGNIYVADTLNHRVRRITPDNYVFTIAGTGIPGIGGDNGPAFTAQLNRPSGIAVDASGNLYISDNANQRIRRVDSSGWITTVAGTGDRGFTGDGGLGTRARLDSPAGLAVDAGGNLYFADSGNHVIRRLGPDGVISTVAGNANRGFSGDGGTPLLASLDSPRGIAIDRDGNLYVADSGNRRIRRVSTGNALGPGLISTFPAPDSAVFRLPTGVAVDDNGILFVADAVDQRIFRLEPAGRLTVVAGDGLQGFVADAAPALTARLDTPLDLMADPAGNIFLADSGNGRIRKLTPNVEIPPPAPIELPVSVVSAASLQPGPVAPGQIVSMFGSGLAAEGRSTQVLFNGRPAPLLFLQPTQINLAAPYTMGDVRTADVQVIVGGVVRARLSVAMAEAAPALFTTSAGTGQAAALNEDGSFNSPANPAVRGSIVTFYATGEGHLRNDGAPVLPVSLRIGAYAADLAYAGPAPGFTGLMQINARIPAGYAPPGTLPVTLHVGSAASQPGVVISVK